MLFQKPIMELIKVPALALLATLGVAWFSPASAIVVVAVDSIADGTRTNFVSFSGMGNTGSGAPTYIEDSVLVQQINGDGNDIWTTFNPGGLTPPAWYPNGGDNGYTRITRVGGGQFINVGMLRGSGNGSHAYIAYQLLLAGSSVLSGVVSHAASAQYLGFLGGGFDEVRLRDGNSPSITATSGGHNALVIDSIELSGLMAAPAPASMSLFGFGLLALWRAQRRRR